MDKNIIFVDCFNTIICRHSSPRDVLFDWAKKVGAKFSIEPAVIFNLYKRYESREYFKNKCKTGEGEYKFADVLDRIVKSISRCQIFNKVNVEEFKSSAVDLYVEAEKESHYLNEEVVNLLKEYKQSGKRIYVVSDFYCGKDILSTWLESLGILDLFDDIYVSCDYHKSKRTGKLYKHIIKTLGLNKKEILMMGDNHHSDYAMAKRKGISAKKIDSKPIKKSKELKIISFHGANYIKLCDIFDEYGEKYNYSNYAFPLYLFNKRLAAALKANNVKDVFFMAREGQILKKLFDKYCETNGFSFNTHYFYVSRNSVLVSSLAPLEEEDFSLMLRSIMNMNIKRFLTTLNFTKEEIDLIASSLDVSIDKNSSNFVKSEMFKKLKENEIFRKLYEEKRVEQREAFTAYLKSFNVNFEQNGMHMVDVGWYGTIQDFIAKYFNGNVDTTGYYMGTFDRKKVAHSKKIGLFFSKPNNHIFGNKILAHRRLDYEQLCRADHNRVKGYRLVDGHIEIIYGDEVDDNKAFKDLISPLQKQIYSKFTKICELDYEFYSNMETLIIKFFYKMFCKQSKEDFEWLRQTEDCCYDNFARIGYTAKKFDDALRLFAYKTLDLGFKVRHGLKIKCLKSLKY